MSGEPSSSTARHAVVRVAAIGESPALDRAVDAIREDGSVAVSRYQTVTAALDRVASERIHGVVCLPEHALGGVLADAERGFDERLPMFIVGEPAETETALEAGADGCIRPDDPDAAIARRVSNAAHRYRLETAADDPGPRGMLDGAASLVAVVSPDGTVTAASPAAEAVLDYTADELEGRALSQFTHPSDRTELAELRRSVADAGLGASEHASIRFRHGDGIRYSHRITVTNRLDDPAVGGLVLTVEHGDSRTAGVDDLASAIEAAGLALFAVGDQWELRYASDSTRPLFARPPETGSVLWDILPDATVSTVSERLREARRTDSPVEFTVPVDALDRDLGLIATPTVDGVVVMIDVSDRESADAAGVERDPDLEPVLESLEDGLCVLEDGQITYANAALLAHLSVETLDGRALADVTDDALATAVRKRATPPLRWLDPLAYVHDDEPRSRRFDVFVTPLSSHRTVCLFRPEKRSPSAQFDALDRAVGQLDTAGSITTLRETTVTAFVTAFDFGTARWLSPTDDGFRSVEVATERNDHEPSFEGAARIDDAATAHDASRLHEVLESGTPTVLDPGGVAETTLETGVSVVVPVGDRGLVAATLGERGDEAVTASSLAAMAAFAVHVDLAFDAVTARSDRRAAERDRDRALARHDAATARLAVVGQGVDGLLAASTQAEVEAELAASLGALTGVTLAWTGSIDLSTGTITPRSVVGDEAYLESTSITVDAAEPTGQAVREEATVTIPDLGAEGAAGTWSSVAREHGLRSALSVPLLHESVLYGTVTAYAGETNAFDTADKRACELLAAVGAYALATLDVRDALAADVATEIEALVANDADPLTAVAVELDAAVRIEATAPRRDGGATIFCVVEGIGADALDDAITGASDIVGGVESIEARGGGTTGQIVVTTGERTIADALTDHGGRLRHVSPGAGGVRLTFDLPRDGNIRAVLSGLEPTFGTFDPRVRRRRELGEMPPQSGQATPENTLTESQRQTLAAAYHAGYFEWPRERTGEEVASLLGVSQPTFNRHFRAAERNLFAELFGGREDNRFD
ncbi:helix-turn-helix domain-containing protein [Halobacteria archaeon AArc-dxtr1]|nr:helix-turn-helix domain-containing protein [Halobacteria archaeon AArc-dxtr1]